MQSQWNFFTLSVFAFIVAYVIGWHLFKFLSHGLSNDGIFFAPIPQIPTPLFSNACCKMCMCACQPVSLLALLCICCNCLYVYIRWGSMSSYIISKLQKQSKKVWWRSHHFLRTYNLPYFMVFYSWRITKY